MDPNDYGAAPAFTGGHPLFDRPILIMTAVFLIIHLLQKTNHFTSLLDGPSHFGTRPVPHFEPSSFGAIHVQIEAQIK